MNPIGLLTRIVQEAGEHLSGLCNLYELSEGTLGFRANGRDWQLHDVPGTGETYSRVSYFDREGRPHSYHLFLSSMSLATLIKSIPT